MSDVLPLNEREEALWMLQRLFPDDGVSNLGFAFQLSADIDLETLQKSALWVTCRYPMLRSLIQAHDGHLVRAFRDPAGMCTTLDRRTSTRSTLDAAMRAEVRRAFDIEHDELVRFILFDLPGAARVLLVVIHHLVFDALSAPRFVDDLTTAYHSFAATGTPPVMRPALMPDPGQVEPAPESLRYWSEHLAGLRPGAMLLPATDYTRALDSFVGQRYERAMSPPVSDAVRKLRLRMQTSDNIILLAAYLLLLLRHGAGPDLVIGIPLNLRPEHRADDVGFYFSTVPLMVRAESGDSFAQVVERTHDAFTAAHQHRSLSYEAMIRRFPRKDFDWQTPVFRHLFNFLPFTPEATARPGWITHTWQVDSGYSRYDLEFVLRSRGQGYDLQIAYRRDLHDEGFVRRLYDKYEALVLSAADDPECEIGRLPMATDHDKVVEVANQTPVRWRGPQTVLAMVDAHIDGRPGDIALASLAETTTYGRLGQLASRISARLAAGGVRAGDLVAVVANRGPVSAAAILAAWRAGAAYLPLDPGQPLARLQFELQDAGVAAIVADADTIRQLGASAPFLISAEELAASEEAEQPVADHGGMVREPDPGSTAYVIYTSGSTGKPKGVQITHAGLANAVCHFRRMLAFDASRKMLWLTSLGFDISALELLLPLSCGGIVVAADDQVQVRPELLVKIIKEFDVDVVQATPTTWRMVAGITDLDLTGRRLLCGGEPLSGALARQLLATGAQLVNVYGPTETTIWSTAEPITGSLTEDPPAVGRPIANTAIAVVDEYGADCPVDVVGEVVIGGAGVASGYLRRASLTAARFIRHDRIGRAFRTGDLGRWRPDGRLVLHGRADRQVKVHGGRVELDEVESILELHPAVEAAAVVVHLPGQLGEALAAFVVHSADVAVEDLWNFAAKQLPSYAVPSTITFLTALPANASGKIDYPRLTELAGAARPVPAAPADPVAADSPAGDADELTAWLVGLWRELLENQSLQLDSNLFLSGGQSLLAIAIGEQIRARYGVDLPVLAIFKNPTPRHLAAAVQALRP
jgi:amino acid adenylation domain-containing protein